MRAYITELSAFGLSFIFLPRLVHLFPSGLAYIRLIIPTYQECRLPFTDRIKFWGMDIYTPYYQVKKIVWEYYHPYQKERLASIARAKDYKTKFVVMKWLRCVLFFLLFFL